MSDSPHTLVIGVDGGGTGCRVAIGTLADGVLARAEGGRANVTSDPARAIKNVIETVEAAASRADISFDHLKGATAYLGLAGVMTPQDASKVGAAVPYKDVTVTDDRPTALNGAFGGKDGFLLSVGTGTIAASMSNGVYRSVGGWGFHVSDHASGSWLGQNCLRHVLLCHDDIMPHSDLTHAVFAKFKNDPNEIVAFSMSAKPGDYGVFAPEIMEHGRGGDVVAQKIINEGAGHLMGYLSALKFQGGDPLCLSGGVGPHYAPYLPEEITAGLIERRGNALDGAFALAGAHVENSRKGLS